MKIKILLVVLSLVMLVSQNCNQPGIAGLSSNNILGKDATKKLLDAATQIDAIYLRATTSSSTVSTSSAYLAAALLNGILVPIVAGLEDEKYYLKDGVDKCVKDIYALGLVIDNYLTVALSCDIKPTPVVGLP
ncbi:TIGR04452 family lipoprotein [Leptospira perdikensis]|uniref:TIGR04452 family lipoprotein n=1 Tax=Leptospira perdikensis TaxID=2484948 RepID=A0A4R9J755_9LEPT|nr:TIGR04452 family lipoprotein [Leptospira perdikensis]TGL33500.1 TIGR04452 family lipoprotein [Leptospira perdikensis]